MWYMSQLLDSDFDLTKAQISYDKLINSEFIKNEAFVSNSIEMLPLLDLYKLLTEACLKSISSCYTNNNGKNWEISLYAG